MFAVNTSCRNKEIFRLQWDWEVKVPELNTSVFLIPEWQVKNREERLVVLNKVAHRVIEEVRGVHSVCVYLSR
ncbi:site-specific integrase [Rickettsiella massiliensis]|uniref:hypothetical protein n=1 Tax=Rickettsiella massiliensis TaxID=676517 RepID=UPI0012E9E4C5|nr:hypothetical protein [Rickettsiella massiliensis]